MRWPTPSRRTWRSPIALRFSAFCCWHFPCITSLASRWKTAPSCKLQAPSNKVLPRRSQGRLCITLVAVACPERARRGGRVEWVVYLSLREYSRKGRAHSPAHSCCGAARRALAGSHTAHGGEQDGRAGAHYRSL